NSGSNNGDKSKETTNTEIATWEHEIQKLVGSPRYNTPIHYTLWIRSSLNIHRIPFFWEKSDGSSSFPVSNPNPFPQFGLFHKEETHFHFESLLNLAEIADGYRSKNIQLAVSSNGNDGKTGHQPVRRSSAPGRTRKNVPSLRKTDTHKNEDMKKPKSNNQEEIIALFRKIQTSIAEEAASSIDEDSNKDEDGTESILEALTESRKQVKGKTLKNAGGVKGLRRKGTSEAAAEFKLVRPPSNFVKRSPIPSPAGGNGSHLTVENMKLRELKAVAKSRGIKGYSKLKKNELLELLTS
ncbi:uncharacterized protein LOC111802132, partial [Cucurbita pepo subsp. pepo]|uniref:uncharacterized protein LOC111802132 n=1 Tax=Cucurbita pepo subsp. pepo TaxID=3664 RepID=UPI000C9D311A